MDSLRLAATVLPEGTERVMLDVPGRYVLPGLVDAHAHLTLDMSRTGLPTGSDDLVRANLAAHRANGVLLVRDIGRVRDEPLVIGPDEPEVHQAGRFLAPDGGWVEGLHVATPPDRVLDAVRAQLASGVRWVKVIGDWKYDGEIRPNYEPALLRSVAEVTHEGGARFAVHAMEAPAARDALAAGADSVEHGCNLDPDLLPVMAARGVAWTPTLSAVTQGRPDAPERDRRRRADWLDAMRANLPRAVALGVPVLAGTDTAAHGSVAGEVALLVEFGLTPVEAMRAATTTARTFLGAEGLTDGAVADFVTYDADPRDDVRVLREPVAVVRRGVRVGRV